MVVISKKHEGKGEVRTQINVFSLSLSVFALLVSLN